MGKIHRIAYTVTQYEAKDKEEPQDWWTRIGVSFLNRDQSETLLLNALPVNGKIVLRDPKAKPPAEPPSEE